MKNFGRFAVGLFAGVMAIICAMSLTACVKETTEIDKAPESDGNLKYSEEAEKFSDKWGITVELAKSLSDSLGETKFPAGIDELNKFERTDDYAFGERYTGWYYDAHSDTYYHILVYVSSGAVESIYDTTNGGRELIYNRGPNSEAAGPEDGTIRLVEGTQGDFGKSVSAGGETYFWYMVPAGKYSVENKFKMATIFVVSDTNSDDVVTVLRFNDEGETDSLTVPDGYHIELSIRTDVELTPDE